MIWQAYKLVFIIKSPLHIGYHKIGNIQRTRYYVLGRNFWAAVTQKITQALNSIDFVGIGRLVSEHLIFGYFFPAIDINNPLYPRYASEGIIYGRDLTAAELEYNFISSIASTAISPESSSAEIGNLHEIEFISPYWKERGQQVYLVGYLFARHDAEVVIEEREIKVKGHNLFGNILKELQIGGERTYGFGRLSLNGDPSRVKEIFGCDFHNTHQWPVVKIKQNDPVFAHCLVQNINIKGVVESLMGREWDAFSGAGTKPSRAEICWVPGSIMCEEQRFFQINPYGIFQKVNL